MKYNQNYKEAGYYHQNERDEAVGQGFLFFLVLFAFIVVTIVSVLLAGATL